MKRNVFFLAVGFWLSLAIKDIYFLLILFVCGLFLFCATNTKYLGILVIWIMVCLVSLCFYPEQPTIPKPGTYVIEEIKTNYAIASDSTTKVLLYDLQDIDYGDQYKIKEFKHVHSLNNLSLFSFEQYLQTSDIYYQGNVHKNSLVQKGRSLRSDVYRFIRHHSSSLQGLLYGIYKEDTPDLVMRLSLPLMAVFYSVEKALKRFASSSGITLFMILIGLLCGLMFVFTASLCRYICQKISRYFFKEWEYQFACTTFLFLLLMPQKALSFAFVLPSLFSLTVVLCSGSVQRWLVRKLLLFGLSFLYFQEIDGFSFLCFSWLRKWSGIVLLLACVGLWFPTVDISTYWIAFADALPSFTWFYDAGFLFLLVWLTACFGLLFYRKQRITVLLSVATMLAPFVLPYCDPFFRVTVFSIGQADCTLITEPFLRSAVLIDCGENIMHPDNMEKVVLPYLQKKHISRIDAVILTHEDFDHIGGIETLKEHLQINAIITQPFQKINVSYPFYSLLENRDAKEENDKSIISYFTYDDQSYLWMGDASRMIEKQLLHQYPNVKADILKVGHHGSKTSSLPDFLYHVHPQLALISSGKGNRYGHPDLEVLNNLQKAGIDALNTADVGMIQISSFHGLHFFQTGNHIFGIIGSVI